MGNELLYKVAYDEAVRALSEQQGEIDEVSPPAAVEDLHWELAEHMYGSYLRNRRGLNLLAFLFQVATSLLAIEIVLWIIAIASKS